MVKILNLVVHKLCDSCVKYGLFCCDHVHSEPASTLAATSHSPHTFDPLVLLLWRRSRHTINSVFACNNETRGNDSFLACDAVSLGK